MKRFVVLLLSLFILPLLIHAQTAAGLSDLIGDFSFSLTPEIPGPNQTVDITLENYSVDLNTSTITWTVNGAKLTSGKGVTDIKVSTGGLGSHTVVTANITTSDGQNFVRSTTLTPGEVDLLWQGDTYAPPFYKGLSLWSDESDATLLAIPHVTISGSTIDPANLVYRWKVNGTVQGDVSGAGRNTFTLTKAPLSISEDIVVDIMSDPSTVVAEGEVTLNPTTPQLVVYEDNPLYGIIFGNAIDKDISLKDQEVSFVAMPMFMSVSDKASNALTYAWTTNASDIAQKGDKVTYRAPDGGSGNSQVSVSATNKNTTFQSAEKDFLVQFGSTQSI